MKRFQKKEKNEVAAIQMEEACHRLAGFEDTMKNLLSLSKYSLSEELVRMEPDRNKIYLGITERLCKKCPRFRLCFEKEMEDTFAAFHSILDGMSFDTFSSDKKLVESFQGKCLYYSTFLSELSWFYQLGYQDMYWNNKIYELRKQMHSLMKTQQKFISCLREEVKKEYPIPQKKKMESLFLKHGIHLLWFQEYCREEDSIYIEVWVKCRFVPVSDKKIPSLLEKLYHKKFISKGKPTWIGREVEKLKFVTAPAFHDLTGMARCSKEGETIWGDAFSFQIYEEQKAVILLSDGMGTGKDAFSDSRMLVETVEDLLQTGIDDLFVMELLHQSLMLRHKDVYSTLDLATISLRSGVLRLLKAGSAATFIKRKNSVERISGSGLPLGSSAGQPFDVIYKKLQDGDMLIMVSDGMLAFESMPELPFTMEEFIADIEVSNPEKFVEELMEAIPIPAEGFLDDCTVIATALYQRYNVYDTRAKKVRSSL